MPLTISEQIAIPDRELRVSFARSSGPGGQNVNKVESKVQLRWNPSASTAIPESDRAWLLRRLADRLTAEGDLLIASNRTRDQVRNREDAEAKLAETVRATKPSLAAKQRRIDEKKARGQVKKERGRVDE
jgi:ribosome-associated protein